MMKQTPFSQRNILSGQNPSNKQLVQLPQINNMHISLPLAPITDDLQATRLQSSADHSGDLNGLFVEQARADS